MKLLKRNALLILLVLLFASCYAGIPPDYYYSQPYYPYYPYSSYYPYRSYYPYYPYSNYYRNYYSSPGVGVYFGFPIVIGGHGHHGGHHH